MIEPSVCVCYAVAREALYAGHAEGLTVMPDDDWVQSKMYNPQYFPLVSLKDHLSS